MARSILFALTALFGAHHQAPPAPCPTVAVCRAELAHARQAIAWQKRARRLMRTHLRRVHQPAVTEAIRLAARATGVPEGEMLAVASCESHGDPYARNASSGATGVFQFLPSTWRHTPFAAWPATDPYANALAAAVVVRQDGGWHQWSCRP